MKRSRGLPTQSRSEWVNAGYTLTFVGAGWLALVLIDYAISGPLDTRFYLSTKIHVLFGVAWVLAGLVWTILATAIDRRRAVSD